MANDAYKNWYVQGLRAMKSAADMGKGAPEDAMKVVTAPELKALLEDSAKEAHQHAEGITQLLGKASGGAGDLPNKIEEGIRAGNRHMVEAAKDPDVRDASLIAAAQVTLHYRIAAYGTLATTAKYLGMENDAAALKRMTDEAKTLDERFTQLAKEHINKKAA